MKLNQEKSKNGRVSNDREKKASTMLSHWLIDQFETQMMVPCLGWASRSRPKCEVSFTIARNNREFVPREIKQC